MYCVVVYNLETSRMRRPQARFGLWPVWLYHIFPHFLLIETIKKIIIEYKVCFSIFSTILYKTFVFLRRSEHDMIKNVHWSSYK